MSAISSSDSTAAPPPAPVQLGSAWILDSSDPAPALALGRAPPAPTGPEAGLPPLALWLVILRKAYALKPLPALVPRSFVDAFPPLPLPPVAVEALRFAYELMPSIWPLGDGVAGCALGRVGTLRAGTSSPSLSESNCVLLPQRAPAPRPAPAPPQPPPPLPPCRAAGSCTSDDGGVGGRGCSSLSSLFWASPPPPKPCGFAPPPPMPTTGEPPPP
mmetsp:Transcript_54457/g.151737  ORF Transcript_54457/g.151737 Transcript_54457/m.151737 type:complete len:216 (-) Transcript_54457:2752-3399(-)